LLVDGPASVQVAAGKVEVFGYQPKQEVIVVREGKRLPFYVVEKATFNVSLGAHASMQEIEGNTVPQSWSKTFEAVLSVQQKPTTVLILGKIDSGKSSFCTYIVNKLLTEACRVAVLDGDIGQSDIGPSGTIGYGVTSKSITELHRLKLQNAFFVGITSPILAIVKTIEGLTTMKGELLQRAPDFVVINTDGWVSGDIAIRYKTALVKELKPDVIVAIQRQDELEPLIASLEAPIIRIDSSTSLSPRTAEKRRNLREMTYSRYLEGAKIQCYPLNQVTVEPKDALPKRQEPNKGLLLGLHAKNKFLGIGVLRSIDPVRKVLKIQTSISAVPSKIVLGKVLLDRKLCEIQD